jgi:hypothetical protein
MIAPPGACASGDLSGDILSAISGQIRDFGGPKGMTKARLRKIGLAPARCRAGQGYPGLPAPSPQHVGGALITEGWLAERLPVENATLKDRTVIPWNKDNTGFLKSSRRTSWPGAC